MYLTPRKLYKIITHDAGSSLITFLADNNIPTVTGVLYPSVHLNSKATFSLKKEKEL